MDWKNTDLEAKVIEMINGDTHGSFLPVLRYKGVLLALDSEEAMILSCSRRVAFLEAPAACFNE